MIAGFTLLMFCIFVFNKIKKSWKERKVWAQQSYNNNRDIEFFAFVLCSCFAVFSILTIMNSTNNLIKDIHIPEIRVYEELKKYKNK